MRLQPAGAAVGGLTGGLIGLGIPEIEARRNDGKIRKGNLLISVPTENSGQIARAREIFTEAGAEDLCVTGEAFAPDKNKDDLKTTSSQPPSGRVTTRNSGSAVRYNPTGVQG